MRPYNTQASDSSFGATEGFQGGVMYKQRRKGQGRDKEVKVALGPTATEKQAEEMAEPLVEGSRSQHTPEKRLGQACGQRAAPGSRKVPRHARPTCGLGCLTPQWEPHPPLVPGTAPRGGICLARPLNQPASA